ncbi:MAG: gliding motility-associated C-terminal domain-containing protein [Polaribacter sp.]|nr:gliding motility-associated C-terminal domain-containing protein [Polaribacter sp.]
MSKKSNTLLTLLFFTIHTVMSQITAITDYDTVEINTSLNVDAPGVLENDTGDGDLTLTRFFVNGLAFSAGETASLGQGSISLREDGSYTFVPISGYTGTVNNITYEITNGTETSLADLLFTVEFIDDLLEVESFGSCNQGFNSDGEYKILYSLTLRNKAKSRDTHENTLVRNIDLVNNLETTFGNSCVLNVDLINVNTSNSSGIYDYVNNVNYPREFDNSAINSDFANVTSSSIFNTNAINDFVLYPGQTINVSFCVAVNPDCNGRPFPTPSGSGINFVNTIAVTSSKGDATDVITLTDFHTTEAVVTAGLYIQEFHSNNPDPPGAVNPDGTYDFTNRVVITNSGSIAAQNINFNMGLDDFMDKVVFNEIIISQIAGPSITINPNFNGDDQSTLLLPNNVLPPEETIILEVSYKIGPIDSNGYSFFYQTDLSQTQGSADGFDAFEVNNKKTFSFVTWSDNLGNHLDRYYNLTTPATTVPLDSYCTCSTVGMRFLFDAFSTTNKVITETKSEPNGILEHEEFTFQITIRNTSPEVQLDNLQLTDNLNNVCSGNIISVSTPTIVNSTATETPILNTSFNGSSNTELFDGISGLLKIDEIVTVEFTAVFTEACIGENNAIFTARDPLNRVVSSIGSVSITSFSDTDNDGISDDIDIDDDNDTIPDLLEHNGLDPLGDTDSDFIPNYRDTDFGVDLNTDGIVDVFDFDKDGVPNHFDLDSENDGIFDIVEAGNIELDTDNNGRTNNNVGANGLDNSLESNDSSFASITYILPNTDNNGNSNFLDIDADDDGIVDNIEGQLSANYINLSTIINSLGINTAYPNGISPVDTENDGIPDYIDINSDDDIRDDIIEGWDTDSDGTAETLASNIDSDNDGLDDAFDNNNNLLNPTNGQTPQSFPNADNVDNPELDWREIIAIVILIDDITEIEGNDLTFSIQLVTKNNNSIPIESASPIDVSFSTINGTSTTDVYDVAISPFDFLGLTNSVFTIDPFTNSAQFTITSYEDIIYELTEFFTLTGSVTSNNTLTNQFAGIGSLLDNEDLPAITMNNSIEQEGVNLLHTIAISHPCSTPIEIELNTNDDLAISPEDYTSISEKLTIDGTIDQNNANTQVSFNITSILDNLNELDEEVLNVIGIVQTANVSTQDLMKTATILDVDPNPFVQIDDVETEEGNFLKFNISLLNEDNELMQNHLPINLTLETIDDTANANLDYQLKSKQITIPALISSITETVNTLEDSLNEETESFFLQANIFSLDVSNASSPLGTGFIKDNDYPNLFSPNGDGNSDELKIAGIEDYPNFKISIYNRQGNEVYNYNNNGNLNPVWWDGTYKGQPVPTGVYYYILDFNDGIKKPITNFIQLIR